MLLCAEPPPLLCNMHASLPPQKHKRTPPMRREQNSMADLQANIALDLLLRLGAAAAATPSGYRAAAAKVAGVLALPTQSEVARMEGADDFRLAVAEVGGAVGWVVCVEAAVEWLFLLALFWRPMHWHSILIITCRPPHPTPNPNQYPNPTQ